MDIPFDQCGHFRQVNLLKSCDFLIVNEMQTDGKGIENLLMNVVLRKKLKKTSFHVFYLGMD
jgi:hypothetical protein